MKDSKCNENTLTGKQKHLPKQNCREWEAGHSKKTGLDEWTWVLSVRKQLFYLLLWSQLIKKKTFKLFFFPVIMAFLLGKIYAYKKKL